ncbi:unnamed protein product [Tilletia controversa]|uniref:Uncharacterized protein n=3 Tax=Tilletia TaxID=13289 RepID=A0A8X7SWP0_9BASI|nr:hypothetical protein CF336_g3948 [Tilletia laevis]KAE8198209.1 hypothetical protein CF328_g3619 [Tilletia controversa]KAE8261277.1 hypothetical protein A4X03_0g3394 [Tilletia caries]KAE8202930.1 hypothetical protein CF335_g3224 [Tilletia laevis]KAE8247468.1 hypothetical protein A4X06_0g4434 [Tilletia controversa]
MKFFAASVFASLVGLAFGRTGPLGPENYYSAAPGLQIGVANLTVLCNVTAFAFLPINNIAVTALVQFTNANYVGLGDVIQIESGIGRVKIGGDLTGLLGLVGVNSLTAKVTELDIIADGTQEEVVDISQILELTVPNTTVVPGKPLFIQLPTTGGFSVTARSDGKSEIITAALGAVKLNATVHSTFLGNIPATVSCPALQRPIAIGFIRAEPGYKAEEVPKKVYDIVEVPAGSLLGTAGIEFTCTAGSYGTFKLPTYVSGYIASLTVKAGSPFQFENGHATVTIPQSFQKTIRSKQASADSFSIKLTSLKFSAEKASPEINDIASSSAAITTNTYKLKSSGSVKVDVPGKNGLLPPVEFTADADAAGELALTYLDSVSGSLIIKQGTKTLQTVAFNCPKPEPRLGLFNLNIL